MSKSNLSFSNQFAMVKGFILSHRDSLRRAGAPLTDHFIHKLCTYKSKADLYKLIENDVNYITFKDSYIFDSHFVNHANGWDEYKLDIKLPNDYQSIQNLPAYVATSHNDVFGYDDCSYASITELRMIIFAELIDIMIAHTPVVKKRTAAKKTTAKKVAATSAKPALSIATVKNNVAFVDFAKHCTHMQDLGDNVDLLFSNSTGLDKRNQIDHVINAAKCCINEATKLIDELTKAKAHGAEHVIDECWCTPEKFNF